MRYPTCWKFVVAALSLWPAAIVSASPIIDTNGVTGPGPFTPFYTVSSTDLINGMTPSAQTGNFAEEAAGGVAVLTNGTFGTISGGNPGNNSLFATAGTGEQVTYSLNLGASPQGYLINRIATYSGWNDNGRDQQLYTVAFSTVANPTTFVDYATVNFNPTAGSDPTASRVQISDSTGIVANNVAAIRFTFDQPAAPENGYTGYTEIDVIGQAVPEPTALGLVALSAAGLLARRRR
jgi:hypothetical protein